MSALNRIPKPEKMSWTQWKKLKLQIKRGAGVKLKIPPSKLFMALMQRAFPALPDQEPAQVLNENAQVLLAAAEAGQYEGPIVIDQETGAPFSPYVA